MMLRFGHRIIRAHCFTCRRIIWPWQARCYEAHTACRHAELAKQYAYSKTITPEPPPPWPCRSCGWLPS